MRNQLETIARSVAHFAGVSLPNPERSCLAARRAFDASIRDLRVAAVPSRFASNPSSARLEVAFEYVDQNGSPARTLFADGECPTAADPRILLPIKALTVRISAGYEMSFLGISSLGKWTTDNVRAVVEVSTRLIPTDVVLVVENSNSLLSPLKSPGTIPALFKEPNPASSPALPFDQVIYPQTLSWKNSMTKAESYTRACFGETAYNMKRAAVMLYDLLSSSASFRVGVVHTITTTGSMAPITVPLTARCNAPLTREGLSGAEIAWPMSEYGVPDTPESRCAAATGDGSDGSDVEYPVPVHPFAAWMPSLAQRRSLTQLLMEAGGEGTPNIYDFNRSIDDPGLFPREFLWIRNSGSVLESGFPDERATFYDPSQPVLRALDMLNNAPPRGDGEAVRRKVILVLADGFESSSYAMVGRLGVADNETSFARANGSVATDDLTIPTYCSAAASGHSNAIRDATVFTTPLTNTKTMLGGVKLGLLWYGYRPHFEDGDRWSSLNGEWNGGTILPGHDAAGYRTVCNTYKWAFNRGIFWQEVTTAQEAAAYATEVAPQVARTLFTAEVY